MLNPFDNKKYSIFYYSDNYVGNHIRTTPEPPADVLVVTAYPPPPAPVFSAPLILGRFDEFDILFIVLKELNIL